MTYLKQVYLGLLHFQDLGHVNMTSLRHHFSEELVQAGAGRHGGAGRCICQKIGYGKLPPVVCYPPVESYPPVENYPPWGVLPFGR